MDTEKRFKTKTGFCHILPDKILLTEDGIVGNIENIKAKNGILIHSLVYSLLSIFLFYLANKKYEAGETGLAIVFGLVAAYLVYGVLTSINNSDTTLINRDSIQKTLYKQGVKGLTRARFEVYFRDSSDKLKKRLIMLPGSLTGGDTETDIALRIMKEEGLIE